MITSSSGPRPLAPLVRFPRSAPATAVVHWAWCTAVLCWASALLVPSRWLPVALPLCALGVALSTVDLRHRRLPDALTLPAYPLLGAGLWCSGADPPRVLLGGAAFFAVHLAVRLLAPSSMGGGDVKLSGALGAVLASVSWWALPGALVVASAVTLVLARWFREGGVPHGPGLLAATWLAVAVGG
ncbi:prepilin peptidase [Saccharothrix yanglingensis]|uniref:Prepilin peptidase n=1 Tax=Saccharothrix yanglingensis TaxID=659496 RepID=A0ABU0X672_9PSEU|nr:A24 family peptidase [Saccharothrix yanglingensis]MDQ2587620.1 prepilin peptidase [Saccharothrix yanglingensis]